MKLSIFSTKNYDRKFLEAANAEACHELSFHEARLSTDTALLAAGSEGVCAFVNDQIDAEVIGILAKGGTRLIVLRCAGFNQVDLEAAAAHGIDVRRVPAYSPYAVAEFALGMILALNRKYHRAYNRVREGNFSIDGLMGFDLHGRTVGIIGTGKIGCLTVKPLAALGCEVIGSDPFENPEFTALGGTYVEPEELLEKSDIISLHCPLTPESHHLINTRTLAKMRDGVMIINTSRGALIKATDMIGALKSGKVGYLGIDVYEQEGDLFYQDLSNEIIQDDVLQRLLTFPNVIVTSHQAYFTDTALRNICETTIGNINDFIAGKSSANEVRPANAYGVAPAGPGKKDRINRG
ncbi:MAG: 2-hydroxyacid dehydrogenase [Luteolibacter sp.]